MKGRTSHLRFTLLGAFRLAERTARLTGERQRVELIGNHLPFGYRWRVRPVEAPPVDTSYDPTDYANGGTA
jgi:hypothetical protein